SMISSSLGINAADSLNGTTVLNTIALQNGANVLRVHDVLEAKQAIALWGKV
ncbi:MAG: dihydropteroate synthase, partial [Chitinophagaceae bacterium]